MQTRATHPKTARREEKSNQKKEERIGAQLMAEITEPTDDTATAAISDPTWTWRPSSSNMQTTWSPQPELQCSGHGGLDNACTPAPDLAALLQWTERLGLRNHATVAAMQGSDICNNSASFNPPIPDTAFASKMLDAQGRPTYADFAKPVPQENPFTRATAQDVENNSASGHDGTSQTNITQYNHGCSGSQINYHYHAAAPPAAAPPAATAPAAAPPAASAPAATAPAAAPAATAPPSSEAQQLADMKEMFEQGLIPSREIYEDKVRQILCLR